MTRIAVFASGRGSNFDAILAAIREKRLDVQVVALVSDRADAPALDKARAAGIRPIYIPVPAAVGFADAEARRQAHEEKILAALEPLKPRFLVMAGYMRILTSHLIEAFRDERGYTRIVNVHPSLLPSFPGVSAYEQAFHHGVKVTGVTVHLVERVVDDGPICAQEAFSIADCGSVEEVEKRGLALEHQLFPRTLSWVLAEDFDLVPAETDSSQPFPGQTSHPAHAKHTGGPKSFRGENSWGTRSRVRPRSALREETV